MKVLIIHCTYKFKGGEDTVVAEEIQLLRSKGITVELLSFSNNENTIANLLQLPFNVVAYKKTKRTIKAFKPHLVHIHNLHFAASPSVIYAIKKTGLPIVMTLHNFRLICPSAMLYHNGKLFLDSLESSFPWKAVSHGVYKNSRLLTFWLALSMQFHKRLGTWKHINRFILLTEHAFNIILKSKLKLSPQQLVIKSNFSSSPSFTRATNGSYFLFVGRLSEEKGIRLLLQAFSIVNYKLKIAGDGPLKKEVQDASSECNNIEYLGALPKEEVNTLMANCNALIFPSTWYEAMPLTIIEAFAAGAPVIASRLGAMEQMIRNGYNGLHFKAGDLHELVKSLNHWLTFTETERAQFNLHARSTYENKYTPEANAEQLLQIYQTLTGLPFGEAAELSSGKGVPVHFTTEHNAF